jgi:hypothetical protein
LQPLIDIKMASRIDVSAVRVTRERVDVTVVIYRGPLRAVELVFQDLWAALFAEPSIGPWEAAERYQPFKDQMHTTGAQSLAPLTFGSPPLSRAQPFTLGSPSFAQPPLAIV